MPLAYTADMDTRIAPDASEMEILAEPSLPREICRRLLAFYSAYHERNLEYFLGLRDRWHTEHPGETFAGLCANVNPLTGAFRPEAEQKLWGWGDGRALATWSGFLATDRVPQRLRQPLADYVGAIYRGLRSRCHHGKIPHAIHYREDNAVPPARVGYSTSFAAAGFCRYGLYAGDGAAMNLGLELLRLCREALSRGAFEAPDSHHGPRMIHLGVIVDIIDLSQSAASDLPHGVAEHLLEEAFAAADWILGRHFRLEPRGFWEHSDAKGPVENDNGYVVVDPGHATEFAGFLAELTRLSGDNRLIDAALAIHLFADEIGFTSGGVMTKYADLNTGEVLGDTQAAAAAGRPTAPWWNVREHAAAALRLYTLTGDERLLHTYRRAQNASYLHYPNERIGGQMIQAVDPWSCEPLDIPPATGNLDPMHDPRARMREIECLELLINDPQPWQNS